MVTSPWAPPPSPLHCNPPHQGTKDCQTLTQIPLLNPDDYCAALTGDRGRPLPAPSPTAPPAGQSFYSGAAVLSQGSGYMAGKSQTGWRSNMPPFSSSLKLKAQRISTFLSPLPKPRMFSSGQNGPCPPVRCNAAQTLLLLPGAP